MRAADHPVLFYASAAVLVLCVGAAATRALTTVARWLAARWAARRAVGEYAREGLPLALDERKRRTEYLRAIAARQLREQTGEHPTTGGAHGTA